MPGKTLSDVCGFSKMQCKEQGKDKLELGKKQLDKLVLDRQELGKLEPGKLVLGKRPCKFVGKLSS